jgi:hypothetical protein
MLMPETTMERERFACSRIDGYVTIVRTLIIHRNSAGEIDARALGGLDCESRRLCAVGREGRGFDWSKCEHPELARA